MLDISDSSDTLQVIGDSGDEATLGTGWSRVLSGVSGSQKKYVQGDAELVLSSSIDAEYSGSAVFYLKDLNGKDGFRLDGASSKDEAGHSVSDAGDLNKDGYDDVIVGAWKADGEAGESYVVFGKRSWSRYLRLSSLNGKQALLFREKVLMTDQVSRLVRQEM